jgi:signal transduction histidine kinase
MNTRSIVRDATAMVLAVELVCGIVLCSTAILHERHARYHELEEMVRGSADSLVGAVQDAEDPGDHVTVDPEEFQPRRGDLYAAYTPDQKLIGASSDAAHALTTQPHDGFSKLRVNGHTYRVYQREALRIIDRYETGGTGLRRPFTVVYAMPMDHIWDEILEATQFYVLFSAALLALTAVLMIALLRWLLRPLNELAASASLIEERSLHFAPPASSLRISELRPVSDAIAQSMTRLQHAFTLQRRFVSDAAHELKTAVAVVRSSVQVLTLRARSAEQYQAGLDRILADNTRVEELVARMLTLARYEESPAESGTSCRLDEQVQRALNALQNVASLRSVALRAQCESERPAHLSADDAQTLLSNLITNAVEHSPSGSEVVVRVAQADTTHITLEVRDAGSGIAPENLPHVFERFFREDPSRSRLTGGAGLGLAIAKSIVENAGGTISIQSEPGAGTLVTVTLPAA